MVAKLSLRLYASRCAKIKTLADLTKTKGTVVPTIIGIASTTLNKAKASKLMDFKNFLLRKYGDYRS